MSDGSKQAIEVTQSFAFGRCCRMLTGAEFLGELLTIFLQNKRDCLGRAITLAAERGEAAVLLAGEAGALCGSFGLLPTHGATMGEVAEFVAGFNTAELAPPAPLQPVVEDSALAAVASKADEVGFSRSSGDNGRAMKPRDSFLEEYCGKPACKAIELPWFDTGDFLRRCGELTNQYFGTRWLAFSLSGRVYLQTTTVYDILIAMAVQALGPQARERFAGDRDRLTLMLSALRHVKAVSHDALVPGFYWRYFDVQMKSGVLFRRCSFVPLLTSALPIPEKEVEGRKVGKIAEIVSVQPHQD